MKRYESLMELSGTDPRDIERVALLHILASNDDLYSKVGFIYNFRNNSIRTNCLGYSDAEIEENLNMGEKWSVRCAICESPLSEEEHYKCETCENMPDLCTSSQRLIKLGFNLFNGYSEKGYDVRSLLAGLDENNFKIAMEAIKIRFERLED